MLDTISKPRAPMLWAATAFALGIVTGQWVFTPAPWLLGTAAAFAAATVLLRRRPARANSVLSLIMALLALAAIGAIAIRARTAATPRFDQLPIFADGREVSVTGYVVSEGATRRHARYSRQSIDVVAEQVSDGATTLHVSTRLRVAVYDNRKAAVTLPELRFGQRLRFRAKLREPRNFGNPGAWDYRGYLLTQGIVALANTRSDKVELLPGRSGTAVGRWQARARRGAISRIHALWPEREAALIAAMLIGDRSELGRATEDAWQRTGVYHVLVVSGMNVGLLAFAVFWTLRLVRAPAWLATIATVLLAAAYAFLADLGAPIVRATLMIAIFLVARLLYRERSGLNALGTAAIAILAWDSHALMEPSFQLTFLSVAAIAGVALPLLERTSLPYSTALRHFRSTRWDLSLAPLVAQFRVELRMLSDRVARVLGWVLPSRIQRRAADRVTVACVALAFRGFELALVSALMQAALALPMAVYFHRASLVALPANLLATPVTSLLMIAAAVALLIAPLSAFVAKLPAAVAAATLGWMSAVVEFFSRFDAANVRVPALPPAIWIAASVALAATLLLARARKRLALASLATLVFATAAIVAIRPQPELRRGVLEVTAIDVGQADSLLVAAPSGATLLVDAGGSAGGSGEFDFGEEVVSPYLWARGISRLDYVALTHAHADHMGGMRAVIENFRPRELWIAAELHGEPYAALTALLRFAREQGVHVRTLGAGERIDFGGAAIDVLAPPAGWHFGASPRNEDSLVLKASYGTTAALLTGDAEQAAERTLVARDAQAGLLKVAHNGSKTSTSPELLAAVRPRFALISVGAGNSYGHPRPEVLERLSAAGARVYRTDRNGAVTFHLDGERITPVRWDR